MQSPACENTHGLLVPPPIRVPGTIHGMIPMLYAPRGNDLSRCDFVPRERAPAGPGLWPEVRDDAERLWQRIAVDNRLSPAVRAIATRNIESVAERASLTAFLPRGEP